MTLARFKRIYRDKLLRLKRARGDLNRHLEDGLKRIKKEREDRGLPADLFRIRLKETRLKEAQSLFNKINDDPTLKFERAFEPGHVRDLLGARIVCHNLADAEKILGIFKKGNWPGLQYIQRSDEEKNWLHVAQGDSGYYGCHFDVRWPSRAPGGFDFAELQVRTLVQDAWATFMHDDVYKHKADLAISVDLLDQVKDMSHLLHWVDQWADRVRAKVETSTVSPSSNLTTMAAVAVAMYAMAGFFRQAGTLPHYKSVSRRDSYKIRTGDADFQFDFQGEAIRACEFSFAIGGDTPVANCKIQKVVRRYRGVERTLLGSDFMTVPGANTIVIKDKQPRRSHDFQIRCSWRGVFERGREYVWCPWADLYPNAQMNYELTLSFDAKPKKRPRLFNIDEFSSLPDIFAAFASNSKMGRLGKEEKRNGSWRYFFKPEPAHRNFLCLFELGT